MRRSAQSARAAASPAPAAQPTILEPARVSERAYSVYAQSRRTEAEPAAAAPTTTTRRKPKAAGRPADDESRPAAPAAAQPAPGSPTARLIAPTESQIRERAYQLYLSRNGAAGSPTQDWLKAEQQLRTEAAARQAA